VYISFIVSKPGALPESVAEADGAALAAPQLVVPSAAAMVTDERKVFVCAFAIVSPLLNQGLTHPCAPLCQPEANNSTTGNVYSRGPTKLSSCPGSIERLALATK
jgi:hypothetical protein